MEKRYTLLSLSLPFTLLYSFGVHTAHVNASTSTPSSEIIQRSEPELILEIFKLAYDCACGSGQNVKNHREWLSLRLMEASHIVSLQGFAGEELAQLALDWFRSLKKSNKFDMYSTLVSTLYKQETTHGGYRREQRLNELKNIEIELGLPLHVLELRVRSVVERTELPPFYRRWWDKIRNLPSEFRKNPRSFVLGAVGRVATIAIVIASVIGVKKYMDGKKGGCPEVTPYTFLKNTRWDLGDNQLKGIRDITSIVKNLQEKQLTKDETENLYNSAEQIEGCLQVTDDKMVCFSSDDERKAYQNLIKTICEKIKKYGFDDDKAVYVRSLKERRALYSSHKENKTYVIGDPSDFEPKKGKDKNRRKSAMPGLNRAESVPNSEETKKAKKGKRKRKMSHLTPNGGDTTPEEENDTKKKKRKKKKKEEIPAVKEGNEDSRPTSADRRKKFTQKRKSTEF